MEKIINAKTVEEAVSEGLRILNKTKDEVEWEVIEEESRGFLGLFGNKDATIRMWEKSDLLGNSESENEDLSVEDENYEENIENIDSDKSEEIERAFEFLKKVLENMGIEAELFIERKDEGIYIDIRNVPEEDKGIIIGRRAQTLDALQYITSLVVNRGRNYTRIFLNVEGYREEREEILKHLAEKTAKRALKSRKPIKLEPMNPYERRIIHSYLQDFSGVYTYSEGNDPYRYVVICRK